MFYILFICYFCFYFIFTVYRNVPNTVVFMVRKGMKKAIWNTAPLYPWGQYNFKLFPTTPSPHRLLHFDIFSNHAYYSTSPSIRDLSNGQVFRLILSFLSNRLLRLVQYGKSSQEYPINAGVPQGFILGPTLFLITSMTFLMFFATLLSMLMILLSTLSMIRHSIFGNK